MSGKTRSLREIIQKIKKQNEEKEKKEAPTTKQYRYTVKASLPGRIRKQELTAEIERWVQNNSKMTNKASLVLNVLLAHCLESGVAVENFPDLADQKIYRQCFRTGLLDDPETNPLLQTVWDENFAEFPVYERINGENTAINYAVKNMMTSTKNYYMQNLKKKINAWTRQWMKLNDIDDSYFKAISYRIKGWNCDEEIPVEAMGFIQEQRQLLHTPVGGINDSWILRNMKRVAKYFCEVLRFLEQFDDIAKFTLAPVSQIKSHYLTIDTQVLYYMMRNVGLYEGNWMDFQEDRAEYFKQVLNLKGSPFSRFAFMIETDGVGASIHFQKEIPIRVEEPIKFRATEFKLQERKKKTILRRSRRLNRPIRGVGIDPGRANLLQAVWRDENGVRRTCRLKKKEYYRYSGMDKHGERTRRWMRETPEITEALEMFSAISTKTTDLGQWAAFLGVYVSVYDTIWDVKTTKKWRRSRFRVYCQKRKVVDRFFRTFSTPDANVVAAYGAAIFPPTARGERPAPTSALRTACKRHFPTVLVDEHYTSQVCPRCDQLLGDVKELKEDGSIDNVRGLKWCQSTRCFQSLLKSRDRIAAQNILRCYEAGPDDRPQSLCRLQWVNVLRPPAITIRFTQTDVRLPLSVRFNVVW